VKATTIDWLMASPRTLSLPYTIGLPSRGSPSTIPFDESRFQITREVARGGMGRILAATDRLLGRQVAIKVALTNDPITQQRLGREAAILSSLSHDSLPPIYELGSLRGLAYFVTRLVDGETLEQRLRAAPDDWAASLPAVAAVAEVMDHVHRQGVIHRDLKPSNILLERRSREDQDDRGEREALERRSREDQDDRGEREALERRSREDQDDRGEREALEHEGQVVIVDWGIARRIQPLEFDAGAEALHDLDLTAPGTAIGTPGYWSPEQRRGEPGDATSDVYSLGAIVFRMATGRASRAAVPARPELVTAMRDAPSWLVDLVARATAFDRAKRFPSAAAFAAELRRGLAARPRDPSRPSRASRFHAAMPALATVFALVSHDAAPCRAAAARSTADELTASGHWRGDFGAMTFTVSGDRVRGAYSHDQGVFVGRIAGNRIIGHWCEAPYASARDVGDATLTVKRNGADIHVAGHYRYRGDAEWAGRWYLEHDAAAPSPALTARLASDTWRCGPEPQL
jgi:eukaryotic-like serine/threonine-protein kinase